MPWIVLGKYVLKDRKLFLATSFQEVLGVLRPLELSYFDMGVNTYYPSALVAGFYLCSHSFSSPSTPLIGILLECGAFKENPSLTERQDRCEVPRSNTRNDFCYYQKADICSSYGLLDHTMNICRQSLVCHAGVCGLEKK